MSEIEIYRSTDQKAQVEVRFEGESVWLTQKQLAIVFGEDSDTRGLHIKNIYSEKELNKKSTTELFPSSQSLLKGTLRKSIE